VHDDAAGKWSGREGNVPMRRLARLPSQALLGAVHIYQGMRAGRLSPCRFVPSCSEYAVEAIETHGALKGSWLTLRRLSRCRPLGGRGYDPVPN